MKRTYFFWLSLIFIFCTVSYANEKEPRWVKNPPPGVYVGISRLMDSEQEARNDAVKDGKRQIVATLGGFVETEIVDQLVESSESSVSSFTDSKVKIVAKNILSVKPSEIYVKEIEQKEGLLKKKKVYQAYAAIEFSEATHNKFMDELVNETEKVSRGRFEDIKNNVEAGQIVFALSELAKLPGEYDDVLGITGLSPTQMGKMKKLDQDVKSLISELQNNIYITSEKQKFFTKLNRPLAEVPQVFVYFEYNGEKIPVKAADVKFEAVSGKIDFNTNGKTNDQGIATCKVNEVCCNDKAILRAIVAFPDETKIDPLIYNFYLIPDNIISIRIFEKNIDEDVADSYLENLLIQKFTEMEFQVVDNEFLQSITGDEVDRINVATIVKNMDNETADFLVFGNVLVDRTNKMRDNICFAWAKATVKVYDVQQMEIIESMVLEEKGAGNAEHAAGVAAIKKVSEAITEQLTEKIMNKGKSE